MDKSSLTCEQIQRLLDLINNNELNKAKNYIIRFGTTDQYVLTDIYNHEVNHTKLIYNLPFTTRECMDTCSI